MNATVKQSLHYLKTFDIETVRLIRYGHYGSIYFGYVDAMVAHLTGFKNIHDMAEAGGRYRPSLNVTDSEYGEAFTHIADAYDLTMELCGDERRAFRF